MRWARLQNVKCPKDNFRLEFSDRYLTFSCICGFKISKKRFEEIVNQVYNPENNKEEDNLEGLSNL